MKHISIQCKLCKKTYEFDITEEQYEKYIHKDDLNRLTNYVRIVILQKNKENKLKKQ